jgi:hypothetical protein
LKRSGHACSIWSCERLEKESIGRPSEWSPVRGEKRGQGKKGVRNLFWGKKGVRNLFWPSRDAGRSDLEEKRKKGVMNLFLPEKVPDPFFSDGMELAELAAVEKIKIKHYLMIDSHYTWWDCGKSYLCRILDMLHMGYVDEVLFGYEVVEKLPEIVREWAKQVCR